ncbi:hypothetical protein LINGRAHAP2_LOCUS9155 [Linum grandiflorum]
MALFDFKSNNHFVASSDGANLQVYELTNPNINLPSIRKTHWMKVATIQISLDDDTEDTIDEMSYSGLMFFDGHGRIEEEEALTMLAQHLKELHLLVSPEGYCFQEVFDLGVYSDYGIDYLRLNDLFSWPRYGVELATTNVWSRLELAYHLPRHKKHSEPGVGGAMVSKEKYKELKRSVKEKDEELEMLKEEIGEANEKWEMADEEHRKQLRKKENELRMLKRKKDDEEAKTKRRIEELEKLNDDLEEANKAKDEELRKKDREEAKARRIEQLEKLNEELEGSIEAKDEKLRRLKKEKDEEIRKILENKRGDDEEAKTRKAEAELEEVKKELNECHRKSWAILHSTKFLPQSLEAKDKYLATRRRVPPGTFICYCQWGFPYVSNSQKLVDKMIVMGNHSVRLVDAEENSLVTEWPPLPTVRICLEDFDKNNWWYLKTSHPEGGLTMLVYLKGTDPIFLIVVTAASILLFHCRFPKIREINGGLWEWQGIEATMNNGDLLSIWNSDDYLFREEKVGKLATIVF